jgi:predicted ArsR family transcriptional regulator
VLAERFGLTTAAVRRHLDTLLADGAIVAREQSSYGPRGRGRPAKVFALTDSGRDLFDAAYDTLAVSALRFLAETAGEHAVREFAARHVGGIEARCRGSDKAVASDEGAGRTVSVDELLVALNAAGYSASATTLPGGGVQICQHHCPVAHVAAEFPQLCEAETESFARVLGTHVQRLATIAHGDGVCTTHIPLPATTAPKGAPETPVTPRPASRRTTR